MVTTGDASPQQAPTVLVIDDEDYVTDMLASALDLEGYTVHVAYNGRQALERAAGLQLDLVIVDIMMPYLGGIAVIQRLRSFEQTRATPIVLISAGARPRESIANVTFVSKPFDLDQLLDLVRTRIEERKA